MDGMRTAEAAFDEALLEKEAWVEQLEETIDFMLEETGWKRGLVSFGPADDFLRTWL